MNIKSLCVDLQKNPRPLTPEEYAYVLANAYGDAAFTVNCAATLTDEQRQGLAQLMRERPLSCHR